MRIIGSERKESKALSELRAVPSPIHVLETRVVGDLVLKASLDTHDCISEAFWIFEVLGIFLDEGE